MRGVEAVALRVSDAAWAQCLSSRLGATAPIVLHAIGPLALLESRRSAFFCSARTSGDVILRAHDAARRLRDAGKTVIGGFHSPIERDCLRILLRGGQPIIVCPARATETMRIPKECRAAFDAGRILFLSPFTQKPKRATREAARRRNELVAALADEAYVAHVTAGGETARIVKMLEEWNVPVTGSNRDSDDGE